MIYQFYASVILFIVASLLSFLLIFVNSILVVGVRDVNKSSTYECGFQPIDLNLQQFDVKFYIVGLLFLLFDVEILFLLPFFNVINFIDFKTFITFLLFMFLFLITFIYE